MPLHSRLENSREDLFAVRVNVIFFIDVGRVVVTSSAVNLILLTVRSEDRVIAGTLLLDAQMIAPFERCVVPS